jgi:hypothetical protein
VCVAHSKLGLLICEAIAERENGVLAHRHLEYAHTLYVQRLKMSFG